MQGLVVSAEMSNINNFIRITINNPSQSSICAPAGRSWPNKRTFSCSSSSRTQQWSPQAMITDHRSFFNSLSRPVLCYPDEFSTKSSEKLRGRIEEALLSTRSCDPTATMEMIDDIQRLGIGHYFEGEINEELHRLTLPSSRNDDDLFATSLRFRLLRNNGFSVSTDVFKKFMNKKGQFEESLIGNKKGMLSLYEASYLGTDDEELLLQAMDFTKTHITHPLELPRHMRMARLEARSYVNQYSKQRNCNSDVLNLAMFDFDMVQSQHQAELTEIIRWWKELGLVDKLSFARDTPLECFLWTVGIFPEPRQSGCRIELAKAISILQVMDDIFDTYGSLDELVLFADAINRWDLGAMEHLPEYMKICYMALHNTVNDLAYRVLKEHGWNIVPHLHRVWKDLAEAYLVEARWFNKGYVPTFEEYLVNGVTSGGTYLALVYSFFLMGEGVTKESIALLDPYPNLFTCPGKILRLWDDLGTAKEEQERGDVASSIECYMKEKNITCQDQARRHIKEVIGGLWRDLNGEVVAQKGLPPTASLNVARTCQVVYQHGDDNNSSTVDDHVQALLFRPIGLSESLPKYVP